MVPGIKKANARSVCGWPASSEGHHHDDVTRHVDGQKALRRVGMLLDPSNLNGQGLRQDMIDVEDRCAIRWASVKGSTVELTATGGFRGHHQVPIGCESGSVRCA